MILSVDNINVHYGAIQALRGVSFHLNEGEIVTLIGANGAGKSTSLNTISGLLRPTTGTITYHGEEITSMSPPKIVSRGLIQVPEGRKIFSSLTVWENLDMGAYLNSDQKEKDSLLEMVYDALPPPQRTDETERRHSFRRRTADAGDWPGINGQTQSPAPG